MQITHEEAQRLVQFDTDGELDMQQRTLLASHLEMCANCQQYAKSIERMESVLRPLLRRTWDREPLPLSIGTLMERNKNKGADRIVLATRIAALVVVFLAFFGSIWNFSISSRQTPTPLLHNVPVIPTPFTSTVTADEASFEGCTLASYVIQENDTLAALAARFAISEQQIRQINSIQDDTLITGQVLRIPTCSSTPANPAASHTTTFTPVLYISTTTPGG